MPLQVFNVGVRGRPFQQEKAPRLVVGCVPVAVFKYAEVFQWQLLFAQSVGRQRDSETQGFAWGDKNSVRRKIVRRALVVDNLLMKSVLCPYGTGANSY